MREKGDMTLPAFELLRPSTLSEALEILEATPTAGSDHPLARESGLQYGGDHAPGYASRSLQEGPQTGLPGSDRERSSSVIDVEEGEV